ncbi:MAG: S-methyl-5-thioribose-1-phosphate isomerase, partial [Oscillospiraceae bacterium]
MRAGNSAIPDTVALDEARCELVLLDQTRLPGETVFLRISDEQALFSAIARLSVRGAPAIGVAAALGLYVCAARLHEPEPACFIARVRETAARLAAARPTAVNLQWALDRMIRTL